ncbi:XRE family transcriptional regulator [Stappia indica]|uniref:Phage repressor protein C, contains Cro/C1-type HTH and peptisase s24 domains n=1 Tax=Stappia indica TaxID=538381 RepID=A0A285TSU5_9HYPH|nr:helix-turn-helix transcriptional regulator [Stappia indica]SOC27021.1 Phage repressor protein C, contains Cro/C1-type HTH and peptisase s24 domains [Stappia indica]
MEQTEFATRLRMLIGSSSERSFAHAVGISPSALRALLKGGMPTLETLLAIARGANVEVNWLATGEGAKTASEKPARTRAAIEEQFSMIPRLAVEASAGNGVLAHHEESTGLLAFRAEWLRRMGINPTAARALTVKGDSMEPTIRDGDILLVDTSIDHVRDNALYVVVLAGLVFVKRVHVRRDGSLTLISDNPVFPPEEVPANETEELSIAGRVMWFGRSI